MRYDIVIDKDGVPQITEHFCRDWDYDPDTGEHEGCYGTNQDHGMDLIEAVNESFKILFNEMVYRDLTNT